MELAALETGTDRVRVLAGQGYWEVVLTRPGQRNAIDSRMRDQLFAVLSAARWLGVTIGLRGEGPTFCSGGDLGEFGRMRDAAAAHEVRARRSLAWLAACLAPRLTVAVHGACYGAGLEVAAFAGRLVAARSARFCLPEVRYGLIPGAGGTVSVPRRIGRRRALAIMASGRVVEPPEALSIGLVDEVVEDARLVGRLRELSSP